MLALTPCRINTDAKLCTEDRLKQPAMGAQASIAIKAYGTFYITHIYLVTFDRGVTARSLPVESCGVCRPRIWGPLRRLTQAMTQALAQAAGILTLTDSSIVTVGILTLIRAPMLGMRRDQLLEPGQVQAVRLTRECLHSITAE